MDRRSGKERRSGKDRRTRNEPVAVERRKLQRRAKVNRRRQIDPTTCERDYTDDEIEFMNALEQYKRTSGRMFPTCSEILEVLRSLGYEKRPASQTSGEPQAPDASAQAAAQPADTGSQSPQPNSPAPPPPTSAITTPANPAPDAAAATH